MTQKTEYCNGVLIFESNASDLRNVNCNVFVLSPDAPGGNNLLICNDTRRDWQCPKIAAYGKRPSRATLYHAIQKFVTDNPAPAPFIPRNAPRRDRPRQGDGRMMRTVPLQTNRRGQTTAGKPPQHIMPTTGSFPLAAAGLPEARFPCKSAASARAGPRAAFAPDA